MIETLEMFDRALLLKINALHTPLMDTFMWYMSKTWPTLLLVATVAYAFYKKYSPRRMLEFLVGCAIVFACTDLTSNFIKHGVKRYRPTHNLEIGKQVHIVEDYHGGKYGFVSAHAANTFGTVTFMFFCINWIRRKYKLLIFIFPVVVVYSRMYLGVHYPSDVIAGTVIGVFFGWLGYRVMNTYFFKPHEKTA